MNSQGDGLIGVEVITRQHQVTEEEARRKEKKEREDPQVLFFWGGCFSISTWKMKPKNGGLEDYVPFQLVNRRSNGKRTL